MRWIGGRIDHVDRVLREAADPDAKTLTGFAWDLVEMGAIEEGGWGTAADVIATAIIEDRMQAQRGRGHAAMTGFYSRASMREARLEREARASGRPRQVAGGASRRTVRRRGRGAPCVGR